MGLGTLLGPFLCTCVRATFIWRSTLAIFINNPYYLYSTMPYAVFLSLLFLAAPSLAGAQSRLVTQLANEVCSCMETSDRMATPAEQAGECVRLVGLRRKKVIQDKLKLNPDKPEELSLFSERMADQLSQNCPVLSTLRLDELERELRWSDRNTVRKADVGIFRYNFPKSPPADMSTETVSEPPEVWRITGNIAGRPGRGSLRLLLANGKVETYEFPAAVSRRMDLADGQAVTVIYDRQWRKVENGGIIALIIRSIE